MQEKRDLRRQGSNEIQSDHNVSDNNVRQKTFINRGEYMKSLKFPQNSPNLVVIPSNEKGTGFLRTCYNKEILDGLMSKDEFQNIVDCASNVVAKVYSKKRLADTLGIDRYKIILSCVSLILAIIFLGLIYIAIVMDEPWLQISAYGSILASFIIILPLSLYECFRDSSKKFIKFNQSVKKSLDEYFGKINTNLEKRGVQWAVNEGHYWIECRIVREFDNMGTVPTTQQFFIDRLSHPKEQENEEQPYFMDQFGTQQDLQTKPMSRNSEPEKEDQISNKSKDQRKRTANQSRGQGLKINELAVEKSKLLPLDNNEGESMIMTDRNDPFEWNNPGDLNY